MVGFFIHKCFSWVGERIQMMLWHPLNISPNILNISLCIENDHISISGMFQLSTVNMFWITTN